MPGEVPGTTCASGASFKLGQAHVPSLGGRKPSACSREPSPNESSGSLPLRVPMSMYFQSKSAYRTFV
jgi:hypothetical protein